MKTIQLAGKNCWMMPVGQAGGRATLPVILMPSEKSQTDQLLPLLAHMDTAPFIMAGFDSENWDHDLTPWPAPKLFKKGNDFTGGAADTLRFITDTLMPAISVWCEEQFHPGDLAWGIMGYSLGGLFALWATCTSEVFSRCGACSASLWFDGWLDYLAEHKPRKGSQLYFSLGSEEEHTRNERMRTVGGNTRLTVDMLAKTGDYPELCFREEAGGHFDNTAARMERALIWLTREGE